jgi:hypothetical protein
MITREDEEKIKQAWSQGLTRASFGGGKGTCQITGSKNGSVVLYVFNEKKSFASNAKDDAVPYLLSVNAYRSLKKRMDKQFPQATQVRESNVKKPATKTKSGKAFSILKVAQ